MKSKPPSRIRLIIGALITLVVLANWLYNRQEPAPEIRPVAPAPTESLGQLDDPELTTPAPRSSSSTRVKIAETQTSQTTLATPIDQKGGLRIKVVDSHGEPIQGASTAFVFREGPYDFPHSMALSRITDNRGLTSVGVGSFFFDIYFRDLRFGAIFISQLGLRCAAPFTEYQGYAPDVLWITEEPKPNQILVLQAPPFGWLQIDVEPFYDFAGSPIDDFRVAIRGDDTTDLKSAFKISNKGQHSFRVGPVGLNVDLLIDIIDPSLEPKYASVAARGPSSPGEVVQIPITIEPVDIVTVKGIALDELGVAIANRELRLALGHGNPSKSQTVLTVATNANGEWQARPRRKQMHFPIAIYKNGSIYDPKIMALASPVDHDKSHYDLGSQYLVDSGPPRTLVAAGRITDNLGQPVASAIVSAKASMHTPGIAEPTLIKMGFARTNLDGRYSLTCDQDIDAESVLVTASDERIFNGEPVTFAFGSHSADLQLEAKPHFDFGVIFDSWVNTYRRVSVRVGAVGATKWTNNHVSPDQFCGPAYVEYPGEYVLQILLAQSDSFLAERRMYIGPGQINDFGIFDLRGKLELCHLALPAVDPKGFRNAWFVLIDSETNRVITRLKLSTDIRQLETLVPTQTAGYTAILAPTGFKKGGFPRILTTLPDDAIAIPVPPEAIFAPIPGSHPTYTTLDFSQ